MPPPFDADAPAPSDPEVTALSLDNGFTCWSKPHRGPLPTVTLALHVGCGALDEADDEQGLCHFLEHLAFHGSANFGPGEVLEFFEAAGTRLGRHHNAFTGLDRTCYVLSFPDPEPRTLVTAVRCLADFAHGLTFDTEVVETERRVILEEMRARRGPRTEATEQVLGRLVPGSRVAGRHPLGLESVVRDASPEQLQAFYRRWYRPDTTALVVAGEVDGDTIGSLAEEHFGRWRTDAPPPAREPLGVEALGESTASVIAVTEATRAEVRLLRVHRRDRPQTQRNLRRRILEDLVLWLTGRRLDAAVATGRLPAQQSNAGTSPIAHQWCVVRAMVTGAPEQTVAMARALVEELDRIPAHGFCEAEVEGARTHHLAAAERAVRHRAAAGSEGVVARLLDAVTDGRPPMSEAQARDLGQQVLPGVTSADLHGAAQSLLAADGRLLAALVPASEGDCPATDVELTSILGRSQREPPQALPPADPPQPLLAHRPTARRPTKDRREAGPRLISTTCDNGALVHVRSMGSPNGRLWVAVTLSGGRIRESVDILGVTAAAALAYSRPASQDLSSVQIRDRLTGTGLTFGGSVEEDAVTLRLAMDQDELERGLELLHLMLGRPRVEAPALARWQEGVASEERRRSDLEVRMARESLRLLTGDDPRFRGPDQARASAITIAEAQSWLDHELRTAPLEVAVVGEVAAGHAMDLAVAYLGSLPKRPRRDPRLDPLRQLATAPGPLHSEVSATTAQRRAAVLSGWRAAPWTAEDDRHLLHMAQQVLIGRLQSDVRQKRGLTYSAECSFRPSRAYPDASLLAVAFFVAPDRVAEAQEAAQEVVHRLAADGPTDGELANVRAQLARIAGRAHKEPKYWARVLAELDYRSTDLAEIERLPERYASYSARDMAAALQRYVVPERHIAVTCTPE